MGDKINDTQFLCKIGTFQKHSHALCPIICRNQTECQLTIIKIPDFPSAPATPECTDSNPVFFGCRQNRFRCLLIVDNFPLPAYQLTALHAHRTDFRKFFINICVRFHTDDHSYPHMFPPVFLRYTFLFSHEDTASQLPTLPMPVLRILRLPEAARE